MDTNSARVARVVERTGADLVLGDPPGKGRVRRVHDAWRRALWHRGRGRRAVEVTADGVIAVSC